MKPPFEWDPYSDQPKVISNKRFKWAARAGHASDYMKMLVTSLVVLPFALLRMSTKRAADCESQRLFPLREDALDFFGMGVSLDHGDAQFDLIDELGIRHVLIRIPLWDLKRLSEYRDFAAEFKRRGKSVLINVLQDREHIEDLELFRKDLRTLFLALGTIASEYQMGNAINRLKWGFFAPEEYLAFFLAAQKLRDAEFPAIELIGPSVIDFEYHYVARALFNRWPIRFDRLSALLYVDRMGNPDRKQYKIFDTDRKIRFLASLSRISPKVRKQGIYITEVNWPLAGTAPYAPTSEKECVSIEEYCNYMRGYHQAARNTGLVSRVYWHQLIAPGYGLIDNRLHKNAKRSAFFTYQKMIQSNRL